MIRYIAIPVKITVECARDWKEYALLDCGEGYKLEQWGAMQLIRPDPQILWPRKQPSLWQAYDAKYDPSSTVESPWKVRRSPPKNWHLRYKRMTFKIQLTHFKHTGLFPEQAAQWEWIQHTIRRYQKSHPQPKHPRKMLNLFGYTGGASIASALEGMQVTHVDASQGALNWAKENAGLSEVRTIRYLADDALKFVKREIRRGHRYDAITLDPPAFGRGPQGEIWKMEADILNLLEHCSKLLSAFPIFFMINTYKAGLSPLVLHNLLSPLRKRLPQGQESYGELTLESRFEVPLPCGLFARWAAT